MRKIIVVIAGSLLLLSVSIMAQSKMSAEQKAKAYTERLAQKAGLDDAQKEKAYAINLEAAQQKESIRPEGGGKPEVKGAGAEIEKNRDAQLKTLFNDDQLAKYETWKAEMKAKAKEKKGKK